MPHASRGVAPLTRIHAYSIQLVTERKYNFLKFFLRLLIVINRMLYT